MESQVTVVGYAWAHPVQYVHMVAGSVALVVIHGIVWTPVDPKGVAKEPYRQDKRGRVTYRRVSLRLAPWRMVCSCGNVRYAPAKCRRQIDRCHICVHRDRLWRRREAAKGGVTT